MSESISVSTNRGEPTGSKEMTGSGPSPDSLATQQAVNRIEVTIDRISNRDMNILQADVADDAAYSEDESGARFVPTALVWL
jgi:hypothetical protein